MRHRLSIQNLRQRRIRLRRTKSKIQNSPWSRSGQSLLEHAIVLVSLFAAVIAMSTYARRGMQARYRTLVDGAVTAIGAPTQYEPYYASASSTSTQDNTGTTTYAPGGAVTFTGQATSVIDPGAKQRVGVEFDADDAWQ